MTEQLAGVATIPLIIGLVEMSKRLGLEARWAAPLAVGLGLALSLGYHLATASPQATALANALLSGLALGLSSAGLYSGTKKLSQAERR